MAMKKRTRLVILAIMLVMTIGLSLVACGPDTTCTEHVDSDANGKCDNCDATVEPEGGDEGNGGGTTTPGSVELVKGGAATFRIVSTEQLSIDLGKTLTNFVKTLNDCIEAGNVTAILEQTAAAGPEIIIGPVVTRGDKFTEAVADPYAYGYDGWSVSVVDGNVLVLAGSNGAYKDALGYLEETIFGISDTTFSIDNVTMTSEQAMVEKQDSFEVSVTIDGNPLSEYVFAINTGDANAIAAITGVRNQIFRKTGVYLRTVTSNKITEGQKAIWIESVELNGDRSTPDGARIYVEGGNLRIESEFPEKLEKFAYDFLMSEIGETKKKTVSFGANFTFTKNVRDIYYSEFGAKGDGVTDDFFAIKECHDYANKWGHNVHADGPDKTYYIGNYLEGKSSSTIVSAIIKTNTNWHGCTFIFDDTVVPAKSACYNSPIFNVVSDVKAVTYSKSKSPITSLMKGATNVGWQPGKECMILIENSDVRHFIRYGNNADSGQAQQEIIIVHADGTIDPSTPLHWDYEQVTSLTVYDIGDTPITITGGDGDQRATVKTMFNNARSLYNYFWRNILVERSNVILQNIDHIVEGEKPEKEGGTGAPYKGFIRANNCNNVLVQNVMIHKLKGYHLETDQNNSMGSYEMGSSYSNNLIWKNMTQNEFYNADGSVSGQGLMGTGYCKNMSLVDCHLHSFDAHQGIYNVTLKNSIFEHINFIGDGDITLEDVTIYIDPKKYAINLRSDYGSWWRGNIYLKNFTMKYDPVKTTTSKDIYLINALWNNHDFGNICYLPQNIYMENINILGFEASVDPITKVRTETIVETNSRSFYLYSPSLYTYTNVDISDPNANLSTHPNDWKQCKCSKFNDTDGNGQCNNTVKSPNGGSMWCNGWKDEPDNSVNINPYIGTKVITLINGDTKNPVNIIWPTTPQFKDMNVTVDGVLIIENGKKLNN